MFNMGRTFKVLAGAVFLSACSSLTDLDVDNNNNPDAGRALASADDVESLIGSTFFNWHQNQKDAYPGWALSVASGEVTSSWGNYGMQDWGTIPRMTYQNNSAYGYNGVNRLPWYRLYTVISAANDGLVALNGGMEFGEDGEDTQRARALAKFSQGLAYAYLALLYDQAFIIDETTDLTAVEFQFLAYPEVMDIAIGMLDEAAEIASSNTFTIKPEWIPTASEAEMTSDQLARLAKSYTARFLAQVARTPAEREAVDWADVIARANQGITSDFVLSYDGDVWWEYNKQYAANQTWQRASYYTIGEADNSGAYQAWLNTPAGDRQPFDVVTDDRRITGPEGPTSDGTDFSYEGPSGFRADRGTYFFSNYMHNRFSYFWPTWGGPAPLMRVTEMDLLKAEGHLRMGQRDAAVPLINNTRVTRGQLPPALATEPVDALMQKMQYEKRIELFVVAFGGHYFDARGWGRLVPGTPIHMPVPARELETLSLPLYTFGGNAGGGAP